MGLDPSAHPAARVFPAVSYFWQGSTERSRPFPTNLRFFASHDPKYSCPPHGSLPHRLRAEPPRRGGQERGRILYAPAEVYPAASGTGGYGIRSYVFCRGDHWSPVPVCLMRCLSERTQLRQVGGRAMLAPTFSIGKVDTRFSNGFFLFRLVKNCHIWYTVFLQFHRQTRCKPATQSYRGPSGQPVANK